MSDPEDGSFEFHEQSFTCGPLELAGLRVFLTEPTGAGLTEGEIIQAGIGNCMACHPVPRQPEDRR